MIVTKEARTLEPTGQTIIPSGDKHEQVRLPTLLRSINPAAVSEQIRKAITWFGGVPGTPPRRWHFPSDCGHKGIQGVVCWVAIFPNISSP